MNKFDDNLAKKHQEQEVKEDDAMALIKAAPSLELPGGSPLGLAKATQIDAGGGVSAPSTATMIASLEADLAGLERMQNLKVGDLAVRAQRIQELQTKIEVLRSQGNPKPVIAPWQQPNQGPKSLGGGKV